MEDGSRLTIFWHPALHNSHSPAIWDIWHTTNLFHFLWGSLNRARAEEKVLSILTCERYRWFDGISGRFDCVCYIPRISPTDPNDSCPHVDPPPSPLTMEQTNLYASPLNILGRLFILNIEPNSVVTCPFYRPIPAPMLISELNRDQISLMWDIIYGQININMWTTSVKLNRENLKTSSQSSEIQ